MTARRKKKLYLKAFGLALRKLRDERGLGQSEIASAASHNRSYLSRLENGFHNPGLFEMSEYAASLGMQPWEFVQEMDAFMAGFVKDAEQEGAKRRERRLKAKDDAALE